MSTFADFNIEIPSSKISGQVYTKCPQCSQDRKKKNAKCLSVNIDSGIFNCKNCGWSGSLKKKVFELPKWENRTELPDAIVEFFAQRNIGQEVLKKMKITHGNIFMPQVEKEVHCIHFNYFRNNVLINTKYRDKDKNFRLHKGAELILFNLDGIVGQKEIYITEGEPDAMVLIQAGMNNSCSVPNGASPKHNNLEYIDNCYTAFSEATAIYIMTDMDAPGNNLADELARRLGVERCYRVHMEHKDVNDCLNKGEKISEAWVKERAKAYPMVGVQHASDFWNSLINIRRHGFPKGWKLRGDMEKVLQIHPGYQSIWTGIPGGGKGEYLDQLLCELCLDHELKGAIFSPENFPTEMHLIKLTEKISGQNFWKLTEEQIAEINEWIETRIYWIYPDDGFDVENLLEHISKAVLRYGINWYVLDPWNKIDHQFNKGENETLYISRILDVLSNFNRKKNVHGFLIAHPTKMDKEKDGMAYKVPTLYDISGGAHFYNKADIGLTVHRTGEGTTDVHVQKVKFKYWGRPAKVSLIYNKENGRYYSVNPDNTNWLQPFDVPHGTSDIEFKPVTDDDLPF